MEVIITLDIVRRLRFPINELCDAEVLLRTDLFEILSGTPRFADVRILLWAGLKWEDRKLTLERVGELMDAEFQKPGGMGFMDLWNHICNALREAGPFGPRGNAETERAPLAPPLSANGSSKPSAPPTESSGSTPPSSSG